MYCVFNMETLQNYIEQIMNKLRPDKPKIMSCIFTGPIGCTQYKYMYTHRFVC
jgi:hypothetical protein